MNCQITFSGKNKKNISKCHLLKILPRVLSVKTEKILIETTLKKTYSDRKIKGVYGAANIHPSHKWAQGQIP